MRNEPATLHATPDGQPPVRYALADALRAASNIANSDLQPPRVNLPPGQPSYETHQCAAGVALAADQARTDTDMRTLSPGHQTSGTQRPGAGEDRMRPAEPQAAALRVEDLPADQGSHDTQNPTVSGEPYDAWLLLLADSLDDLERVRIATENRLRSLTATPLNEHDSAKSLSGSTEAATMLHVAETLKALEHRATLDLKRAMRAHPLGPWVKRTKGIGEKQAARLLAAIGDPADRAMPSQLWQYCGHGAPSKRRRGEKTWWNPTAKMRLHLIAESCIKQVGMTDAAIVLTEPRDWSRRPSPYRAVYDEARAAWADRDVSDGHKHNHALRMVGKQILLDLWLEARALRDPD